MLACLAAGGFASAARAAGPGAAPGAGADPWADAVVSYNPGTSAPSGYTTPGVALGSPTRMTGEGFGFPGATTPFQAAFEGDEVVSLGRGGSLVVRFDEPVADDAANPFGIDLLIFGNSFFFDPSFAPIATNLSSEGGLVEVSQDGVAWFAVSVAADGMFPTLSYTDLLDPFSTAPGSVPTDFTRPVDPAFNPFGKDFAQLVAGYNGSGGGAGVDIGSVGLAWIRFVRVSNASDSMTTPEIDGFSDVTAVPAPSGFVLAMLGGLFASRRRRG